MQFPEAFKYRTESILKDEFDEFIQSLNSVSPTSIRVNNKTALRPSTNMVAWCKKGYYLDERPLFTADPMFHAGAYYVQEASSMFLEQVILQYLPDAKYILDLCAAPGGKSTLIAQHFEENALLVCNEIIHSRANILAENLCKWGNPNTIVTNNPPKDFGKMKGFFDAIFIDAPCSGEGMFRKDPEAVKEWSEQNVKLCAERQKEIISSVWDALTENGFLVYSTCTYNREENEDNIEWLINEFDAELIRIKTAEEWKIAESDFGYRFYPHKVKGEGLFLSLVRKKQAAGNIKIQSGKKKNEPKLNTDSLFAPIKNKESYSLKKIENKIYAFDQAETDIYLFFKEYFNCLKTGLLLGETKGKDFIPSAELALSKILDHTAIDLLPLTLDDALRYLKKENLQKKLPDKKGFYLAEYQSLGLGWLKNLGNRFNNLYPQYWKIKMNFK